MHKREDVAPEGVAPESVRKFLLRFGGKTPFGEPMFRVVLAHHVRLYEGGNWAIFRDEASLQDRGGMKFIPELGRAVATNEVPLRYVAEMRWVAKYPEECKGWIVEMWHPPHVYGNPEVWERDTVEGHPELPCLGPFPRRGAYEMCVARNYKGDGVMAGVTGYRSIPSLSKLENTLSLLDRMRAETWGVSREERIRRRVAACNERHAKEALARRKHRLAVMKDRMAPYWTNTLGAGRLRNQLAARAGITSHVGN